MRGVIETELAPPSCCEATADRHGVREVELVDLSVFGRPARLVWPKRRWRCPTCRGPWTERDPRDRLEPLCHHHPGSPGGRRCRFARHVAPSPRWPPISTMPGTPVMDAVVVYGTADDDPTLATGAVAQ